MTATSSHAGLAPGFLLAPPSLADPNFDGSVVLLAAHQDDGAMGFVINRPSSLHLHFLLTDLEIVPTVADRLALVGGPVNDYAGFVLYEHLPGLPLADGIALSSTIGVTPSLDLLQRAATGQLPGRFELLLGYAGWGPGQLDDELAGGTWLHAPFDAELLFDVPLSKRWDETYERLGVNPGGVITVRGGAQA
jgi:putative transcriptional regulator